MKEKLCSGVTGAGAFPNFHLSGIASVTNAETAAICDVDLGRALQNFPVAPSAILGIITLFSTFLFSSIDSKTEAH